MKTNFVNLTKVIVNCSIGVFFVEVSDYTVDDCSLLLTYQHGVLDCTNAPLVGLSLVFADFLEWKNMHFK